MEKVNVSICKIPIYLLYSSFRDKCQKKAKDLIFQWVKQLLTVRPHYRPPDALTRIGLRIGSSWESLIA